MNTVEINRSGNPRLFVSSSKQFVAYDNQCKLTVSTSAAIPRSERREGIWLHMRSDKIFMSLSSLRVIFASSAAFCEHTIKCAWSKLGIIVN